MLITLASHASKARHGAASAVRNRDEFSRCTLRNVRTSRLEHTFPHRVQRENACDLCQGRRRLTLDTEPWGCRTSHSPCLAARLAVTRLRQSRHQRHTLSCHTCHPVLYRHVPSCHCCLCLRTRFAEGSVPRARRPRHGNPVTTRRYGPPSGLERDSSHPEGQSLSLSTFSVPNKDSVWEFPSTGTMDNHKEKAYSLPSQVSLSLSLSLSLNLLWDELDSRDGSSRTVASSWLLLRECTTER